MCVYVCACVCVCVCVWVWVCVCMYVCVSRSSQKWTLQLWCMINWAAKWSFRISANQKLVDRVSACASAEILKNKLATQNTTQHDCRADFWEFPHVTRSSKLVRVRGNSQKSDCHSIYCITWLYSRLLRISTNGAVEQVGARQQNGSAVSSPLNI